MARQAQRQEVPDPAVEPLWKELRRWLVVLALLGAVLIGLGGLAVASWMALGAVLAVVSGTCFTSAIGGTAIGTFATYLSSLTLILSGIGIVMSVLML